ncbi:MAG TPA: glycerophosphoryl diester phosphodiesterase membrane domain-containing protein, partial [Acidimicrobiia bacterium]
LSRPASAGLVTLAAVLVPDLRPLSVGEIIDVAIKMWRRQFGTLARIVFVVVAPVELFATLVTASVSNFDVESFDPVTGDPTMDGGAFAGWLAGMFTAQILSGLAFLISSAAVLRAVSVAYLGGTPDWRESLRAATSRLPSLIWLGFLMFGGLALAAVALIIPAIWLGVAWSVAFPVMIAEGQRGTTAMRRSFRLVQDRWWPTFGALFLAFLLQSFIGLVLGIPLGILAFSTDGNSLSAIFFSMIVNVVASVITTPFMAAVLVLIYFDLRVRKEGFDLQLLAQGVGHPVSPGAESWAAGGASGGHWGGGGGQWGNAGGGWGEAPGGNWPSPGGGPAPPPGHSGWAPPGSGVPASDPPAAPPPAPQFDDPIDPTRPREQWPPPPRSEVPEDPTGPREAWPPPPRPEEPRDPTGPRETWPPPPRPEEPMDPTGPGDESPPPGEQPER